MHYDPDVFVIQFPLAKKFVYHVTYYRTLLNEYQKYGIKCEFWTHTIDAHLLQAAILWCMLFGSDGCNPTHWKNLSTDQSDELKRSFRDGLPQSTGINGEHWVQYHKEMTDFRNEYVAHRELQYKKPVPNFDIALKVVYYYDHWIRGIIVPDVMEEPLLEKTTIKLKAMEPLINKLIETTKAYYENA